VRAHAHPFSSSKRGTRGRRWPANGKSRGTSSRRSRQSASADTCGSRRLRASGTVVAFPIPQIVARNGALPRALRRNAWNGPMRDGPVSCRTPIRAIAFPRFEESPIRVSFPPGRALGASVRRVDDHKTLGNVPPLSVEHSAKFLTRRTKNCANANLLRRRAIATSIPLQFTAVPDGGQWRATPPRP
jgi:hypothetical protein